MLFGGTAEADGAVGRGATFDRPLVALCVVTIAFGCGAAALGVLFAVAGFFTGAFAAGLVRAPVLRLRPFPPAGDLRAVRATFVFLPTPCFRAFVGFLRLAACLRFLAMGNSYSIIDDQKTLTAGI